MDDVNEKEVITMKKAFIFLPLVVILLVICLVCFVPRHPFADIEDEDVDKIVIVDGKLSYTLSEKEQKELIPLYYNTKRRENQPLRLFFMLF